MTAAPRLIGLRALALGDFCCAVPAWKALRRAFPEHRKMLAAPAWQRPLVELCPAIDDLIEVEALAALPSAAHGAELAVNLHGRGPQSSRRLTDAAPQQLAAFRHPAVSTTSGGPTWDADEHEVERWCRLVASIGAAADPTDLALERPAMAPPVARATVLHTGASAAARCWPASRWVDLAIALTQQGRRVVLTGTAADADRTGAIVVAAGLPPDADLAGRTPLPALAALVADAALVVSGDTGVAHLATAYATPSVVLFGPTPPSRWGPPVGGPHLALWSGLTGDPQALEVHVGLLAITVTEVLAAVDSVVGAVEGLAR